jgi:hypothetical protein
MVTTLSPCIEMLMLPSGIILTRSNRSRAPTATEPVFSI